MPRSTATQLYRRNNLPLEEHPILPSLDLSSNNTSRPNDASIPSALSNNNDADNTSDVVDLPSSTDLPSVTSDVVALPRHNTRENRAPDLHRDYMVDSAKTEGNAFPLAASLSYNSLSPQY